MIPVEPYAARTARLAKIAEDLAGLDQAWSALDEEFARVTAVVAEQHDSGATAAHHIARLRELSAALLQVQQTATDVMSLALPTVQEASDG